MRLEAIFDAAANHPASIGAGPAPAWRAGNIHDCVASHPTAAELGKYKPAVVHDPNPAGNRAHPVVAHRTERWSRNGRMIEACPIEVAFDTKQKATGLKIISSLNATDELGDAAIKIVAGNV